MAPELETGTGIPETTTPTAATEPTAPIQTTATEPTTPAAETQPQSKEAAEPEITLSENGEISLSDNYFNELFPGLEDTEQNQAEGQEDSSDPSQQPAAAPAAPAEYTDKDLPGLTLETLDRNRLPAAVKAYLPFLDDYTQRTTGDFQKMRDYAAQLETRLALLQAGSPQAAPAQAPEPPKVLGQKELVEAAKSTAAGQLGIKPDEIDLYDPTHLTALSAASAELAIKNQQAAQKQAQRETDERDYGVFANNLYAQPDYAPFEAWVAQSLARQNLTFRDVTSTVARTGDYRGYMNALQEAYQTFRRLQAQTPPQPQAQVPRQAPPQPQQRPAGVSVPRLESGGGGGAQSTPKLDYARFSAADLDAQAKLLMEAGFV